MILNQMQKDVLSSNKRIVVITAQAGAGSTTALMLKLADEASKSKNNLGVFVRRTQAQVLGFIDYFLRQDKKARYSSSSSILTFKHNDKKVKIKMLSYNEIDFNEYIPFVAIDTASHFNDLSELFSISGKIVISDFMSNVEQKNSWAYSNGLLKDLGGQPIWNISVDHIKGFQKDNLGLDSKYIEYVSKLNPVDFTRLMKVDF